MPNLARVLSNSICSRSTAARCSGVSKCTRMKNSPVVGSPNCCESMMLQPAPNSTPETA
jgi:hypothetical protein